MSIGRLEEVNVRELWAHEQYDFSNWLALEENIVYLNEITGLTLVDIQKEKFVGSYRCDIVAKDQSSDKLVIIENQFHKSNHDHLGKIITYASGLEAEVIIWIVEEAREEHRSAIEWLNNNTNEDISFFLIEIEAYKIGDSLPAPNFKVVEQPNNFLMNTISVSKSNDDLNTSQSERLTFWQAFNDLIEEKGKPFGIRNASTSYRYAVGIGTGLAFIVISLVNQNNIIEVTLLVNNDTDLFDQLHAKKEEISNQFDFDLDWNKFENKKHSQIISRINGLDFNDHSNYPELMEQVIERVIDIRNVFTRYF